MVEEVALAGLVFGVPFEDVKLGVVGALGRWGLGWRIGEGGGGMWKLGYRVGRVWVCVGLSLLLWVLLLGIQLLEEGRLDVLGGLVGEGHLERVSFVFNGSGKVVRLELGAASTR